MRENLHLRSLTRPLAALFLVVGLMMFTGVTAGVGTATAHADSLRTDRCASVSVIFSAYPGELSAVLAQAAPVHQTWSEDGVSMYRTAVGGHEVIAVMTGVGGANATRTARTVLGSLTCARHGVTVSRVLFSGTAGGAAPARIGDVAVPQTWSLGRAATPIPADPHLLSLARRAAGVRLAHATSQINPLSPCGCELPWLPEVDLHRTPTVIVNGRGLTSDPYQGNAVPCLPDGGQILGCRPCVFASSDTDDADAKRLRDLDPRVLATLLAPVDSGKGYLVSDQETAAVATAAHAHGLPFLGIRGISDGSGDPLHLPGFPFSYLAYQQLAAANAGTVAAAVISAT